ncbi:MAG: DegV family protein [Faecalibacterium sp.]|nr:DegV family protein [Faecalibacterium sp.]
MSKIFVTTDATSDMPKNHSAENFKIIQMNYVLDDVEYVCDPKSLDFDEFYRRVDDGSMPTTSLINTETAIEFFTPILKEGFDVLHICFSSALSGTYNALKIAETELKEAFPDRKIAVVDSKAASGGEGFMVWQVLKKRAEGVSFDELLAFAEDVREHCVHFFTVQNLFHLYRGGRVSKTAAVIGSGLNLKPVLHVDTEGRLIPIQKVMGRKASLKALVDDYVIKSKGWKNDEVWVQHGSAPEDAEWVAAKIKEKTPDVNVVIDFIGPIIGTHCGKGILAVFFLGEDKIKP